MKIVVALDSFKGTLFAERACAEAAAGVRAALPGAEVVEIPMADGGEGTVAALASSCNGERVSVPGVHGPLPDMPVTAEYAWLPQERVAVVEMASASGLPLLSKAQRNPLRTSTFGTGQVLRAAMRRGPAKILLTLGGSATVDGGTAAAAALGWTFLDDSGRAFVPVGGTLECVRTVSPPGDRGSWPAFQALCDVTNPLCGTNGAAAVYGPQKGASPAEVERLENGLSNVADCLKRDLGVDIRDLPGAGAAGGFGGGAVAFLGAALVRGVGAVAATCGLRNALAGADWVITGEGKFDSQSLQGKVVDGVREVAEATGVRVAVVAGRVEVGEAVWRDAGIHTVMPTGELDEAKGGLSEQAAWNLRRTAEVVGRCIGETR